jgi:hypothetical protein
MHNEEVLFVQQHILSPTLLYGFKLNSPTGPQDLGLYFPFEQLFQNIILAGSRRNLPIKNWTNSEEFP